jgi:cytochrome c551/c552
MFGNSLHAQKLERAHLAKVFHAGILLGLCGVVLTCGAATLKIELPAETASFKQAPGADIANAQCLICHSVDYVGTQPPLPQTTWAAEVKKMREKYGAAVPDADVDPLVAYLTANYGPQTNAPAPPRVVAGTPPAPGLQTLSGEALATRYGCLGCHNPQIKIVGPPYKDIAAKYHGDAAALSKISDQIHKGGSGKWGPVIMPPFPAVTEAETKALADWILSLK